MAGIDETYCNCGQVKLSAIRQPIPGVEYCIFGNCPAGTSERMGGAPPA